MARITPVPWKKFEKFLLFVGCKLIRTRGDHRMYDKPGLRRPVVVRTIKDLPVFIIKNNINELNITQQEYLRILEQI